MERKDTNTNPTNTTSVFLTAVRHAVRDVCVRHVAFSVGVAVTGLLCVEVDGGEHQVQFVLNEVISKTGSETAGDGNCSTSYCLKSNSPKQRPDSPRRHHGGYYRKRSWTAKANKRKSSIPVATPQLSRRCLTEQSSTGFHHAATTASSATATQATPESATSESPSPVRYHQQHQHQHHQQQGRHHHHHPLLSRVQLATPLTRNKSPPTKPPRGGGAPTTQPLLLSASRDLRSSRTFTIEDDEDDDSSCVDCKSSIYSDTAARSATVGGGLGLGVDRGGGVSLGVGVSGSQQKQNVVENVKTSQQQHQQHKHQHHQQYGAKFRSSRFTAAAGSASKRYNARDVSGGKPVVLNRSGSNIFGRRGTDESPRDTVTCPLMDDVHSSLYCPSVSDVGTFTDSDVDGRSWNSFSYNSLRDETNSRSSITQGGSAHNAVRPSPDLGLSCESETDRPSQKTRSCINRSSINTGPSRTFKGTKGSNPFVTRDRNIPHWQKSCDTSSSTRLVSSSNNTMKDKELLQPRQKRHLELKQNLAAAHIFTLRETLSDSTATCRNVEREMRQQRRETVSDSMACPPPNMQTRRHRQETKSETKSPNLDDNDKRRRDDSSASSPLCEANTTTTSSQTCQRDSEDTSQQQYGGHHRALHVASPESVSAAAPRRDCSSGTEELQQQECCSFRRDDAGGESTEVMDVMEGVMEGVPPSPFSRDGDHDASLCDLRENASTGGSEVCESPSAIVKKKAKRFKWMKFFKKESSSYRQQEGAHTNLPAHEQASPVYGHHHHHHHDAKRTNEQCQRGTL